MVSLQDRFIGARFNIDSDGPALHKPILLLFALGRAFQGMDRMISFREIDVELKRLFDIFYPSGSLRSNTHYPFGKIENDGIWVVEDSEVLLRTSAGHLLKGELLARNVHGGSVPQVFAKLREDPDIVKDCAPACQKVFSFASARGIAGSNRHCVSD